LVTIKDKRKLEHQKIEANKVLFSAWVTDPATISPADSGRVGTMAVDFPYCQILQSLSAKAAQKQPQQEFNAVLGKASLYSPDRKVLFNLIKQPEILKPVSAASAQRETYYEVIRQDDYAADLVEQETEYIKADQEATDRTASEPSVSEIEETPTAATGHEAEAPAHEYQADDAEAGSEPEMIIEEEEAVTVSSEDQDVSLQITDENAGVQQAGITSSWNEEEKMIIENIAAADFFAFEGKLDSIQAGQSRETSDVDNNSGDVETRSVIDPEEIAETASAESEEVARYDDDSMPYSFLWWLHKTRNEHAHTYQPYVEFRLDTNRKIKTVVNEELNQQIIENIFHLASPLDDMETKQPQTVPFEVKRKEEEIIEKFIREEPQIHPPSPDKLDMENKARKSAEDPNDLVSETLASIYTEQMLFHKAIDTYQKLSLKFPEKRAYFADQISELQKKIN